MPDPGNTGFERTLDRSAAGQDRVFAYLANPQTHGGVPVKRIDTHASSIFLAGDRAYKIKRAVRFPYLDYSSYEKRKAACREELAINRRFAPDIYLGVIEITEQNGHLEIDGAGKPIESAVVMKRFDESSTFDELAHQGRLTDALADALGQLVARMHKDAEAAFGEAWRQSLPKIIDENDEDLRIKSGLFSDHELVLLRLRTEQMLKTCDRLLAGRAADGFVRRGHGDLHLGNVALIDGKPTLFDAIEFDPVLATGDILYELAFLLMDLWVADRPRTANIVFNRYLTEADQDENYTGLALMPLFLSLRAAIRAKVCIAKLERSDGSNTPLIESARRYLNLAIDFLQPMAPRFVAIGGLSGSGKSVLAHDLACHIEPAPGAVILRSDVERKKLFCVPENERLPESAYAADISARVYERMFDKTAKTLQGKHSVILDATFIDAQSRQAVTNLATRLKVPFSGLYLDADPSVRLERIGGRKADASDADTAVAMRQIRPSSMGVGWSFIYAGGEPSITLQNALKNLPVIRTPR